VIAQPLLVRLVRQPASAEKMIMVLAVPAALALRSPFPSALTMRTGLRMSSSKSGEPGAE
jgi:hypothetical protein